MRIISKRSLKDFWEKYPEAKESLNTWYQVAKKANWQNLVEVQQDFPHADLVGECVVFNIGGNKYRLIVKIIFIAKLIYIRFVLTHKEYDKDKWKIDCKT